MLTSLKPALVGKSNIVINVYPFYHELTMERKEYKIRKVKADGLAWCTCKLSQFLLYDIVHR